MTRAQFRTLDGPPSTDLGGMAPYLRLAKMQGELDAMRQYLWCVARQQGGHLTVTAAELAECPPDARLSARRGPEGSAQVAALDADAPIDVLAAGS